MDWLWRLSKQKYVLHVAARHSNACTDKYFKIYTQKAENEERIISP
jgi:hypothetical protein